MSENFDKNRYFRTHKIDQTHSQTHRRGRIPDY